MPIDFSQVQQRLVEKLQSRVADHMPEAGQAPDEQQVAGFQQALSAGANGGADASMGQQTVAGAAPLDASQASTPGDRILNHLASMSSQAHQLGQVAAKAAAEGGTTGSAMHAQVEVTRIAGTAGTVTDAVNQSSQSTESLLKS